MGHWTLDNAEVNQTFLVELATLLEEHEIIFDPLDSRIMCFPHIINLCTQEVVEGFSNMDLVDCEDDYIPQDPSINPVRQTFEEAISRDPIALARATVCRIRASGLRRESFEDTVKNGIEQEWFQKDGQIIPVKSLELLRDVKTRWDSVFQMIKRLRLMRPVCFIYLPSTLLICFG